MGLDDVTFVCFVRSGHQGAPTNLRNHPEGDEKPESSIPDDCESPTVVSVYVKARTAHGASTTGYPQYAHCTWPCRIFGWELRRSVAVSLCTEVKVAGFLWVTYTHSILGSYNPVMYTPKM